MRRDISARYQDNGMGLCSFAAAFRCWSAGITRSNYNAKSGNSPGLYYLLSKIGLPMKWNLKHQFLLVFFVAILALIALRPSRKTPTLQPLLLDKQNVTNWLAEADENVSVSSGVGSDVFLKRTGHSEIDLEFDSSLAGPDLLSYLEDAIVKWSEENWHATNLKRTENSLYYLLESGHSNYQIYFWLSGQSPKAETDNKFQYELKVLKIGFLSE